MEAKYYTPEIEEFHIGFEYEQKYIVQQSESVIIEWRKRLIEKVREIPLVEFIMKDPKMDGSQIRTKYLDASDIEELGFTFTGKSIDIWFKKNVSETPGGRNKLTHVTLHYNLQDHELKIDCYFGEEHEGCLFEGFIKNKSELKVLLKQLNTL